MEQLHTRPGLNGTALKRIACVSMLLDHLGASLLEAGVFRQGVVLGSSLIALDTGLRWAGRLAFPLYCFLLVEGFLHTHSIKRYAGRMLLFAFFSETPFDLAFFRTAFYWQHQNVYWTLTLGIAALALIRRFEQDGVPSMSSLLGAAGLALLAELLCADYGASGVLLIVFLYLTRQDRLRQCLVGGALVAYELPAPLAFIPVWFYNGQRGRCSKLQQWIFYWFYPVHLILLALATNLLF